MRFVALAGRSATHALLPTLLSAATMLLCAAVRGAEPSLEELQRRLDAAKRQSPAASAAAPVKRPATRTASMVVQSDTPCNLVVDGRPLGALSVAETRSFEVAPGETLVECRSASDPELRYTRTYKFESGTKVVLQIELAAKVQTAREKREASIRPPAASAPAVNPVSRPNPPAVAAGIAREAPAAAASSSIARVAPKPVAEPRSSDTPGWARIRSDLQSMRGQMTFSRGMATLLATTDGADTQTLVNLEGLLKRARWNSALAMGVDDGFLRYGLFWGQSRLDFAVDRAQGACDSKNNRCLVVVTNGKLNEEALLELSGRLGSRSPEAIRDVVLPRWRKLVAEGV